MVFIYHLKLIIRQFTENSVYIPACWIVCLIGLVWQVYYISNQYFEYETVTRVLISRPLNLVAPSVVLCFRIGMSRQLKAAKKAQKIKSSLITAKQILDNMPEFKDLFVSGSVHSQINYGNNEISKNFSELHVDRSIKQDKLCYTIRMKKKQKIPAHLMLRSTKGPCFMTIAMNVSDFTSGPYYHIYLIPYERSFYGESETFTELTRHNMSNTTGASNNNYVTVSYSLFTGIRLPPPYTTKCINYPTIGFESRQHCYEACYNNLTLKNLGKIPFSTMYREPSNIQFISPTDTDNTMNTTYMNILSQYDRTCNSICHMKNCVKNQYVPFIIQSDETTSYIIELYTSNAPRIVSISAPSIPVIDFITYVLSCISFWLGWSPLGFLHDIQNFAKKRHGERDDVKPSATQGYLRRPYGGNVLYGTVESRQANVTTGSSKMFAKLFTLELKYHELSTRLNDVTAKLERY